MLNATSCHSSLHRASSLHFRQQNVRLPFYGTARNHRPAASASSRLPFLLPRAPNGGTVAGWPGRLPTLVGGASHGNNVGRPGSARNKALRGDVSASLSALPLNDLREAAVAIAEAGAEVVRAALDEPRMIDQKMSSADIVTDTDKASEAACLAELSARFPGHAVLGEEGGVSGDTSSEYLWCVDPLDGTSNFAHGYPSFAVSVACVFRGEPVAACVVEFTGGRFCWSSRTFTATKGGGATCQGEPIQVSLNAELSDALLVTGFGYEHNEPWAANMESFKHFTDVTRGVRRLGAAAVDMCHVSLGIVDAYWEYNLKPWDVAAGVLIVSESGGKVTTMTGGPFSVFDRSVLVSNGHLHGKILGHIAPVTVKMIDEGGLRPEGALSAGGLHEGGGQERLINGRQCNSAIWLMRPATEGGRC